MRVFHDRATPRCATTLCAASVNAWARCRSRRVFCSNAAMVLEMHTVEASANAGASVELEVDDDASATQTADSDLIEERQVSRETAASTAAATAASTVAAAAAPPSRR